MVIEQMYRAQVTSLELTARQSIGAIDRCDDGGFRRYRIQTTAAAAWPAAMPVPQWSRGSSGQALPRRAQQANVIARSSAR